MNKKFSSAVRYSNKNVTLEIVGSISSGQVDVWDTACLHRECYIEIMKYFLTLSITSFAFSREPNVKPYICLCMFACIRQMYTTRLKIKSQRQHNAIHQIQRYIILQRCYNWFCHLEMLAMNIALKWQILE